MSKSYVAGGLLRFFSVLCFAALSFIANADTAWPERMVSIEEMPLKGQMKIEVPQRRPSGDVKRPVTLRVHVDKAGAVKRAVVHESSGSPAHDSGAIRAMREARFAPYVVEGAPTEVTLLVPMHLPLTKKLGEE